MVFRALFFFDICVNIDHGAIPACLHEMKIDLGLAEAQVGSFGSLVFFGLAIGSACTSIIIGRISYKLLISLSFIGNAVGLTMFSYC